MTHRIIHLGDLHLQSTHPRNADRLAAARQAIDKARASGDVSLWVWPGDLFHTRSTVQDRNDLAALLLRMADEAPVLVCYGNHDAPGDLDVFAKLRAPWPVRVVSVAQCVEVKLAPDTGRYLRVFVLPYPSKARLVEAGVAGQDIGREAEKALDVLFMEAAANRPHLMIGHVTVGGAVSSAGQPQIGTQLEIGQAHLDRLGPIPKLLNHIHKHQQVGGAVYAGSLCRLDWGEIEPKGYVEVAYDLPLGGLARETSSSRREPSPSVAFVPLDVAPMYHVEGEWLEPRQDSDMSSDGRSSVTAGDVGRFAWAVTRGPDGEREPGPESWRGCDVRVRVRYLQGDGQRLGARLEQLREWFSDARRLEIQPVMVPERSLRAPEVLQAQTFQEKLRAWSRLAGQAWSLEVERLAEQLNADEPLDLVVRETEERLAPLARMPALEEVML